MRHHKSPAAMVTVRYVRKSAVPVTRTWQVPPRARATIFVNGQGPELAAASLGAVIGGATGSATVGPVTGGRFVGGAACAAPVF